jgi:dCMP deaminase
MRPTRDAWAMGLAKLTAERSTCLRRHVGCVLLDGDGRVLSTGYNGVPSGQKHCNERVTEAWVDGSSLAPGLCLPIFKYPHACPGAQAPSGTNLSGCDAIHAEQNAIAFCQDVRKIDTCYVTTSPCDPCTKLLLGTGCRRIVFIDEYPGDAARQRWERAGRTWLCISSEAGEWFSTLAKERQADHTSGNSNQGGPK